MPATFLGDGNQYKLIYFIYFWYAIILYVNHNKVIVSIYILQKTHHQYPQDEVDHNNMVACSQSPMHVG